jgi:UDP-N-acetylmuramyl pentapeptide phosphotransferase/UDP-N-acetylglucosamine-1-phosphate transferase
MDLDNSTIILILYCVLAFVLAFYPAYLIFPRFIRRMKALGNTGKDVNKRGNIQVAESGGIVAVFSFSLAMFVIAGLASITNIHENIVLPLQAATTVFIAAAIIGFIDDWGLLTRRQVHLQPLPCQDLRRRYRNLRHPYRFRKEPVKSKELAYFDPMSLYILMETGASSMRP